MPDPKRYVNIGVDCSYFPELRSAKLEWQAETGGNLSWSEFFRILLDKDLDKQAAISGSRFLKK